MPADLELGKVHLPVAAEEGKIMELQRCYGLKSFCHSVFLAERRRNLFAGQERTGHGQEIIRVRQAFAQNAVAIFLLGIGNALRHGCQDMSERSR